MAANSQIYGGKTFARLFALSPLSVPHLDAYRYCKSLLESDAN